MNDETAVTLKPVFLGYYDSESDKPFFDHANFCPICGEAVTVDSPETVHILIHCTRFPLATFVRFHRAELPSLSETTYHEIILEALTTRKRLEEINRTQLPEVYKTAFG
jgi:hypothetical protein